MIIEKIKQEPFITISKSIIYTLKAPSLKVYQVLRLEANFKSECSPVTKKIKFISNACGISKSQVTSCLNDLELHGLLKREESKGEQTTYHIAQKIGYFTNKEALTNLNDPIENTTIPHVKNEATPPRKNDDIFSSLPTVFHQSLQKKINKESPTSSSYIFFTGDADDFSFSKFWNAYPIKQGETICRKIWGEKGLATIAELILEKLEEQKRNDAKFLAGYIFSPKNYLQEERWKDEITKPIKTTKTNSEAMSEEKKRVLSMSFLEKCAYDIATLERNTEGKGDLL